MTFKDSTERVRPTRDQMRAQGLRPVRFWAPDTGAPGFADEYSRQCRLVNEASMADPDLQAWDAFIDDGNRELDEGLSRLERTS